ncbi:tetratricopeptide repeat protein [Xanthomonas massiliensis]|uniref:tetratricopeptide repeat protein n=1 Tax=Xanthomonas massiliensis TaxID=1720302 RepID=UPI00082621D8|nr:tetratricopeptide repeat protein [Xanthomonas massiliensis]
MVSLSTLAPLLAALAAMAVAAALLWPLWRGGWRRTWTALVAAATLAAPLLYLAVGTPQALRPAAASAPATLAAGVAQLQQALARDPAHADGWALLGRSQAALGQYPAAAQAYARALALAPDTPDWLVEAAQVRAQADPQHRIDAQGRAWLERALERAPDNERATWFLGIAQRQQGDAAAAARTWEPLLARVDTATAAALRPQIDAARAEAGLAPLPAAAPATGHAVQVRVSLAPGIDPASLPPQAQVFVIARQVGGPPMPVAVERHAVGELPLQVTLDDGDSPMPTRKLASLGEVEVLARLSTGGGVQRQPGDLESAPVRVALPAATPVQLTLAPAR